jgi:restriction endonuclease S subunit
VSVLPGEAQDDLISAKRDLLALLKEKRQAVITHAVTRGLDPAAKLKPSGVEWLGAVPEPWDVKRLKFLVHLVNAKVEAHEETKSTYIGMEHIESWTGKLRLPDDVFVPSGISNAFRSGDVLFGKLRPYLAKATTIDFGGLCSSELIVLRSEELDRHFLLYTLLSDGFIKLVNSSTYGSKMPRANWEFIGGMYTPVPPIEEQRAIARFLDEETEKMDDLESVVREAIASLELLRTSIISAAVTGKIDVRSATVQTKP